MASTRVVLQRWWGLTPVWWDSVYEAFFRTIDFHVPIYWALLGLQHAVDYHREVRVRDVAAAQLETRLVEAQLQALHRQVHPHFLFNTLHAISALVHRDPDRADAMIERLSDMLRVTLSTVGVQEVTVRQELDFLRAYLDIEQVNFGSRLRVTLDVEGEVLDALVPNLVLQPLAENALRHGLAPLPGGGIAGGQPPAVTATSWCSASATTAAASAPDPARPDTASGCRTHAPGSMRCTAAPPRCWPNRAPAAACR